MADAVMSIVVDKLHSLVTSSKSFPYEVRDDVMWLERTLREISFFVQGVAPLMHSNKEMVKDWMRNVRDITHDAEIVVDDFILEVDNLPPLGSFMIMISRCLPIVPTSGFILAISRSSPMFMSLVSHYRFGQNFEMIKYRVKNILEARAQLTKFNLVDTRQKPSNSTNKLRQAISYFEDPNVVGFMEEERRLVKELLSKDKSRRVISIVGTCGLGKTTLANKVFARNEVKMEFAIRIWVSVSQEYHILKLLKVIMESVTTEDMLDELGEEELKVKLHGMLRGKGKYLIVMDDIWDEEVWDRIHTAFPDTRNGSRVMFTTRFINVARSANHNIIPLELPFLNKEESWKLFMKASGLDEGSEEYLHDIVHNLVEKCQGLPLAIRTLGGFLSGGDMSRYYLSRVLDGLDWESVEESVFLSMRLSYDLLPSVFKPCFLYTGSFPEGTEISARQLMRLWTTEGFMVLTQGKMRQEVAEDYLEEIVSRCLVQVTRRRWDGSVKTIRIHNILRELCIKEASQCELLNVVSSDANSCSISLKRSRRLALHGTNPHPINPSTGEWVTPNVHSLLEFSFSGRAFNDLKLLRVVDLRYVHSSKLPKEIASMIHLRYLRWRGLYEVDYQLIKNLRHLQILDVHPPIRHCDVSIGHFTYLQFLGGIKAGMWISRGLMKLTNLRKVVVKKINKSHKSALINSLAKLCYLVSLTLEAAADESIPTQVVTIFTEGHPLRMLKLHGMLSERLQLPSFSAFPQYLTKLTLSQSRLEQDPMIALQELPNLMCLRLLENSFVGKKLSCKAGGFSELRHLTLKCLYQLEAWQVEVGSMTSLTHLTISCCHRLMLLPEGLQDLTTLQELQLVGMPSQFIQRYQEDAGVDRYKIQHIPSIII